MRIGFLHAQGPDGGAGIRPSAERQVRPRREREVGAADLGNAIIGYDADNAAISSENEASVFAFDFGLTYKTGFKSLEFGMVVRNFAKEVRYVNEGFQLPLTFKIGVAMDLFDLTSIDKQMHRFLPDDRRRTSARLSRRVRMGAEYVFLDLLALRAGFISVADEQKFSYGVGLHKNLGSIGLGVDYAYTPFGCLAMSIDSPSSSRGYDHVPSSDIAAGNQHDNESASLLDGLRVDRSLPGGMRDGTSSRPVRRAVRLRAPADDHEHQSARGRAGGVTVLTVNGTNFSPTRGATSSSSTTSWPRHDRQRDAADDQGAESAEGLDQGQGRRPGI